MIKESVKAYGKKQFEIKQKVSFTADQKKINYFIETYFFLPPDLQINNNTYPPEQFQRSMKNYVRLRQPSHHDFLTNPDVFMQLTEKLNAQANHPESLSVDSYESHMKLFAMMYKRALRAAVKKLADQTVPDKKCNTCAAAVCSVISASISGTGTCHHKN